MNTLVFNGPTVLNHKYPTYFVRRWHEKLRVKLALWVLKSVVRPEEMCHVWTSTGGRE